MRRRAPRIERIEPGPGQESVWDYPRPPAVVPTDEHIRVVHAGTVLADTKRAIRVLETSQPPAYYLPPDDVAAHLLTRTPTSSFCEWKGSATYWNLTLGDLVVPDVAWSYEQPTPPFAAIAGHLAFYPQRVDECWVGTADGEPERVQPNPGSFYGGWITSQVVGPFKGGAGTQGW
jgi:uncharacterized protein (DUF427 family)